MLEDWEMMGWPSKEAYEKGMRERAQTKDPSITGVCGVCATCGWGHEADDFADMGFPTKEEYLESSFANRVIIGGKKYCPDCARNMGTG